MSVPTLQTWDGPPITIGVIGGSGLYKLSSISPVAEISVTTPWGSPSSPITIAKTTAGNHVAFLARHGRNHAILPSNVPNLANMAALKHLGVKAVLAFSAVGSLREEIAPKDFVIPSQIIDRTKGVRRASFFGFGEEEGVVAHAGFGDPFCEVLRPIVHETVKETLKEHSPDVKVHEGKTVVCMEGPQFSTRAESLMYRAWGGDIINMSVLPEAKLAREAELAYVLIATATDYDAWRPSSAAVNVAEVMESLKANVEASNVVTTKLLDRIAQEVDSDDKPSIKGIKDSMKFSIMTRSDVIDDKAKQNLRFLHPWFARE
ncbi:Nucleoside phosphorylase domain protein [Kalmanozyma brasiliensis GHG001]|uniref:S-methyl-5'-thioadenosine phosphorylase n=1 Tax=Kalmanozyma brasiliensis (strain GHG001) TaxID=1365824 RepID=V5ETV1_KALBG|nr:Nucleoside phosphorylase domain protein [Kalmanozyma brasiliensis GHG001]EST06513.1 Nucleoside phosphorylase domain protein [Kalmanozyma brasiliensis GHG001]